jgi:hypothetical protein
MPNLFVRAEIVATSFFLAASASIRPLNIAAAVQ